MKAALSYCWFKPEISKSYHHQISKSTKVTAAKPQDLIRRAAGLAKNELS
jgi:hypothetical protein